MRRYFPELLAAFLLTTLTVVAYAPVWNNDFVNYDDADYVTDNGHVKAGLTADGIVWAFTTTHAANWHPLSWLSLQLDHQLYGLRAGGYHITNLLLHVANTLFLFLALRCMTGAVGRSAVVAALFAVHPLHVESVAWVSERKDVLSAFFWMLTLLAYVWYTRRPSVGRYLLVILPFALGLMAKPMLVTLPCVLLLLDYWPLRRTDDAARTLSRKRLGWLLLEKLPLFGLTVASCVITKIAQQQTTFSLAQLPLTIRIYNALHSYMSYIGKMFAPLHLAALYPYPRTWPIWQLATYAFLLLAVTIAAVVLARRRPYLLVGWFWYLGTLVPVLGLVQVGKQAMADRYTYIPLIGLTIVLVWGIGDALERTSRRRVLSAVLAGVVILACTLLTWRQVATWRNAESLWNQALAATTENSEAYFNAGALLDAQGQHGQAARLYREAVRITPDDPRPHLALGVLALREGNANDALNQLTAGLRLDPHPVKGYRLALGDALMRLGQLDQTRLVFEAVLVEDPRDAISHVNLGVIDFKSENLDEARRHFATASQIDPKLSQAHNNLGSVALRQGQVQAAADHFADAVRADEGNALAHCNRASALAQLGQKAAAVEEYRTALRIQPDFPRAQQELAACLGER